MPFCYCNNHIIPSLGTTEISCYEIDVQIQNDGSEYEYILLLLSCVNFKLMRCKTVMAVVHAIIPRYTTCAQFLPNNEYILSSQNFIQISFGIDQISISPLYYSVT